jgi:hypothetical protein
MIHTQKRKAYSVLPPSELDRVAARFDAGRFRTRALTNSDRELHERARRRGRPRIGLGAAKIRISVERSLLRDADALARASGVSRSELIARGLRSLLSEA